MIWWLVLLGVVIGLLPRARVTRAGWITGGLLAGFLVWTWIGLGWSDSHELTLNQVARVSTYLGAFLLSLLVTDRERAPALLGGVASGIAIVCGLAVLSKLVPSLFPANTAQSFYATPRLSYPFDYADAVGEFAALGVPLLIFTATTGRSLLLRSVSAAALPVVLLTIGMTVSRGGILAAAVGVAVVFALLPDRLARLPTLALTAAATGALMIALLHRPALRDQVGVAPGSERHSMLVILLVVLAVTALLQALLVVVMRRLTRPRWLIVSRQNARRVAIGIGVGAVALVVVAAAAGTIASLWHDFKQPNPTAHSNQYFRLLSIAGSHRYQYWQVAIKAFESAPLIGIGPGTFRFYWAQHQTLGEYVLNAHSLWIETLAETGIIGFLMLAGFFASLLGRGVLSALRSEPHTRALIAAATAVVAGFCAAAAFDWVWQIGVIPMAALLVAGTCTLGQTAGRDGSGADGSGTVQQPVTPAAAPTLTDPGGTATPEPATGAATEDPRPPELAFTSGPATPATTSRLSLRRWLPRGLLAAGAILAILLIAVPLAMTVAVRNSQTAVGNGDVSTALRDANIAQQLEPGAASPRLQRALILEQTGDLQGAATSIAQAIAREPNNAQLWLVASRIATERNRPAEALRDYQRARSLDPKSPIFL